MWVKYANEEKYIVQILYKKVKLCGPFFFLLPLLLPLVKIMLRVPTKPKLMEFQYSPGVRLEESGRPQALGCTSHHTSLSLATALQETPGAPWAFGELTSACPFCTAPESPQAAPHSQSPQQHPAHPCLRAPGNQCAANREEEGRVQSRGVPLSGGQVSPASGPRSSLDTQLTSAPLGFCTSSSSCSWLATYCSAPFSATFLMLRAVSEIGKTFWWGLDLTNLSGPFFPA